MSVYDLEHVDPGPLCRDCYRPIGRGNRWSHRCEACQARLDDQREAVETAEHHERVHRFAEDHEPQDEAL